MIRVNVKMNTGLCVFLSTLIIYVNCDLVKLQNGVINGTVGKSKNGRSFLQFYAIPYAEPPVGELRLKAPVPVESWSGIKDGSKPPPRCTQPVLSFLRSDDSKTRVIGQEDCLYLNVFVSNDLLKSTSKTPVIVGIHGGSYLFGAGDEYRPDYFMDKDVILVTINYRLGVLGFFGMNNDHISGNFGLKDQSLALRWIKENIARFGGDPDNVTLLGESAGAASAHLHMFSPLSKGLFQRAIMQSGSAFARWSHHDVGYGEATATTFLVLSGCIRTSATEVLKCLQRIPAEEFPDLEKKLFVWNDQPFIIFKPTIESNVKNQPFLPQEPTKRTYQSNVPWITGMNAAEGAVIVMQYLKNGGSLAKIINSDRKRILPLINDYLHSTESENIDNTTQKIVDFYFGTKDIGEETALKFVEMVTDSNFMYPFVKTVQSGRDRQFVYLYDHKGSFSLQNYVNLTTDLGVGHADELPLLFRNEILEAKWTPQDKNVSETLLGFWTNFAIYGDPNGHSDEKVWKPVETKDIEYLHIKSESAVMESKLLEERFDFWDSLSLQWK